MFTGSPYYTPQGYNGNDLPATKMCHAHLIHGTVVPFQQVITNNVRAVSNPKRLIENFY